MTLVEFIAPLKKAAHRDRILAALYFHHRYSEVNALTVDQIRHSLRQARAAGWAKVNIPDVLAKSGEYVDTPGIEGGRRLWNLTPTGMGYVQDLLSLPKAEIEAEHDVVSLSKMVANIPDPQVKGYVEEAVKCLQVDAIRACIVFLWVGAIRTIQVRLLTYGVGPLNAAVQKHDHGARKISSIDHFAYIKDKITLLAALELGVYDKNQKDTLEEALNLRNRCGHPGKYAPGAKKASSYIEDLISIVFT
jgi:hypothetical protein